MNFSVYILRSKYDNKRYIGSTKNVTDRLKEHNQGKVKSTRKRRPLILLYQEKYSTKKEAEVRERYLKSGSGREWLDRRGIK